MSHSIFARCTGRVSRRAYGLRTDRTAHAAARAHVLRGRGETGQERKFSLLPRFFHRAGAKRIFAPALPGLVFSSHEHDCPRIFVWIFVYTESWKSSCRHFAPALRCAYAFWNSDNQGRSENSICFRSCPVSPLPRNTCTSHAHSTASVSTFF